MARITEYHDLANAFPMISGAEYKALVEDIRSHGLHEPIWTYEGKILDGRNRLEACDEAGVEPDFESYTGDEPASFVFSLNMMRRHLTSSQSAMIASDPGFYKVLQAEALARRGMKSHFAHDRQEIAEHEKGKTAEHAAEQFHTNPEYIRQARVVREKAPELVEVVRDQKMPLPQATEIAKVTQVEQRKRVANRVSEKKSSVEETKRIIADETRTKKPTPPPAVDPKFSWTRDQRVVDAGDGFKAISKAVGAMADDKTEREAAKAILSQWKNYIEQDNGIMARIDELLDA